MRIRSLLWLSLAAAICCGCSLTVKTPANDGLTSTLWVRTAAEYRAASLQTYNTALQTIDRAVGDPGWTAALEQTGDCADLPPAVVMDVDETVLDNARYQAQTVLDGHICEGAQLDMARICHNKLGPFFFGPEYTPGNQRMAGGCIRSDNENAAGIFDFSNGVGHSATSEGGGQTGHR